MLGMVMILLISNATVEAAKKKENKKLEVTEHNIEVKENISVQPMKKQDSDKVAVKEELKKTTKTVEQKMNETKKNETIENKKKNDTEKKEVSQQEKSNSGVEVDGKVTKEDFAVIVNGFKIELGTDINEVVEQLGEPDDYVQARSCLHDGDDKIYTYGGVIIYTYPEGKKDIVYIVEYTGKEKTPSGIGVGSTLSDIEMAYGKNYVEDAFYTTYKLEDNATISFQFDNKKVAYIEFYME